MRPVGGKAQHGYAIVVTYRVKHVDYVYTWHHREFPDQSRSFQRRSPWQARAHSRACAQRLREMVRWWQPRRDSRSREFTAVYLPRMNLESLHILKIIFRARITENKSRLLLAYITGRSANHRCLLRIPRSCLSFFFFFFSQTRLAADKRKQDPQACDVCTNN